MKPVSIMTFFKQLGMIMQETENIGSEMNPYYEEISEKLKKAETDFSKETLAKVHIEFESGVDEYEKLQRKVNAMQAPAKLMILFQQFKGQYTNYVDGCKMMLDAVDPDKGFNKELFDKAEQIQDERSSVLANTMTKMMRFIR